MKAIGKFGRKEFRQALYTILAVLFCFIGPTYAVSVINNFIPNAYALALGFILFLVGIVFVLKLVKEF